MRDLFVVANLVLFISKRFCRYITFLDLPADSLGLGGPRAEAISPNLRCTANTQTEI